MIACQVLKDRSPGRSRREKHEKRMERSRKAPQKGVRIVEDNEVSDGVAILRVLSAQIPAKGQSKETHAQRPFVGTVILEEVVRVCVCAHNIRHVLQSVGAP